jgi:hypothetical protein
MECFGVFTLRLFAEGWTSIATMNDGHTVANIGTVATKEADRYLALFATIDPFTATVAEAKGYQESSIQCTINGRPAKVLFQVRVAQRV